MLAIRHWPFVPAMSVVGLIAGCANLSATQGQSEVRSLIDARTGLGFAWPASSDTRTAIEERVQQLLAQPLSPDTAVQVAFLSNARIQIEYARLGIAAADVLDASRLSNPTFSVSVLEPVRGNVANLVQGGLSQSFSDLLLIRARKRLASGEFERTQLLIADSIIDLATSVRSAWYSYVGAEQIASMRANIATAAQASADLAGKFHDAGNISELQLALEQSAATQARLAGTRARADVTRARAALSEFLGLRGKEDHWTVTDRLALPVPREDTPDGLLELARDKRLDWAAARREVALLEDSLRTTKRYRWMGSVDVGVAAERDTDRSKLLGPSLSLQLPVFNQGQGAIARAQGLLEEKRGQLRMLEVNIDTAVRFGAERIQAEREIAEGYRSSLIPQRETVVARSQENVNYMFLGAFELLLAKQQQYDAYQGYLEAVRDYWLARVDLSRTVGARLPSDVTVGALTIGPEQTTTSKLGEEMHQMHDMKDMHDMHRMYAAPEPAPVRPHEGGTP
jgi:outer membrane protein, heavy metal efflux system